ncbi:MAG: hypothetical protein UX71_C0010G0001 [Parcubacteria group bacterium GW2011_GWA1_47_10]|nr:MAG: hypothetical protein UX71_C0010G0001 [Parcubacteria group bacterium GW2011_GWA1_47_10]
MKTFTSILVLVVLGGGLWWWGENNNNNLLGGSGGPAIEEEAQELCFLKFEDSLDSDFEDKYTLRMNLEGQKAAGELRMLPAEKDALIGKFEGAITGNTANIVWSMEGEVGTAQEELVITLGEAEASIPKYSLALPKILCAELNEREAVEKYLWEKIVTLSPIAPALGGNWYVVSAELDLEKNSGTVTYEDGHIQEKRDFTYVLKADGAVESLTIE